MSISVSGGSKSSCDTVVNSGGYWSCKVSVSWPKGGSGSVSISVTQTCPCGGASSSAGGSAYWVYTTSPIAIDFSGSGKVSTVTAAQAPAKFDLTGNGAPVSSGWIAPSAGFLVDARANGGQVSSVKDLFGGAVGDGFAKLATFDSNGDGVIDAKDADWNQLKVWRDANLNKQVDAGELQTLAQAGIASISIAHTDNWETDAAGNFVYEHGSLTLANGKTLAMNDIYFAVNG